MDSGMVELTGRGEQRKKTQKHTQGRNIYRSKKLFLSSKKALN